MHRCKNYFLSHLFKNNIFFETLHGKKVIPYKTHNFAYLKVEIYLVKRNTNNKMYNLYMH